MSNNNNNANEVDLTQDIFAALIDNHEIQRALCDKLERTKAVVLIHMSANNGDAKLFSSEVAKATGKAVHVAKKGFSLELIK